MCGRCTSVGAVELLLFVLVGVIRVIEKPLVLLTSLAGPPAGLAFKAAKGEGTQPLCLMEAVTSTD